MNDKVKFPDYSDASKVKKKLNPSKKVKKKTKLNPPLCGYHKDKNLIFVR